MLNYLLASTFISNVKRKKNISFIQSGDLVIVFYPKDIYIIIQIVINYIPGVFNKRSTMSIFWAQFLTIFHMFFSSSG